MIVRSVLALLAVAAVALAFWLGRESAQESAPLREQPAVENAESLEPSAVAARSARAAQLHAASVPATASAAPGPTLPSPDAPVAGYFDELQESARKGDARAACWLGAELMRCQRHHQTSGFRRVSAKMGGGLGARGDVDDSTITSLAMVEEHDEKMDRICNGLDASQLDRAFEFQRIAADRGGVRERLWYATTPALKKEFFLENLPEWERYRSVAYGYMEQALVAGDPAAPSALAQVHLPPDSTLPGFRSTPLTIPDAHRHLVYRELSRMLSPPVFVDNPVEGMIPMDEALTDVGEGVDMDQIRAEAEALRQRYYAGVRLDSDTGISSPLGPFSDGAPTSICGH